MTENLLFNEQALFEEILAQAIAEGVNNKDAWDQLVENVLDGHSMWAEVHDDQDLEGIEDKMKARYGELEAELHQRES